MSLRERRCPDGLGAAVRVRAEVQTAGDLGAEPVLRDEPAGLHGDAEMAFAARLGPEWLITQRGENYLGLKCIQHIYRMSSCHINLSVRISFVYFAGSPSRSRFANIEIVRAD